MFARDEDGKPVSGEWLDVKITPKGQDPKGQSIFPVDIKDNGPVYERVCNYDS